MSEHTKIQWTDSSWNPLRGTIGKWHCVRISEGCGTAKAGGCYAEAMNVRFGGPAYKVGADTPRLDVKALAEPLKWREPRMIFVASMTDLFMEGHSNEWIAAVFGVMAACPRHVFQVLTKRAKRMREWFEWVERPQDGLARAVSTSRIGSVLHEAVKHAMGYENPARPAVNLTRWPLPNVWLGVSAENQTRADERIPDLLECPAAVHWVSAEPLLGPIDFERLNWPGKWPVDVLRGGVWDDRIGFVNHSDFPATLSWIVTGGESGARSRACDVAWLRSIAKQCADAKVACFTKQLGARPYVAPEHDGATGYFLSLKHPKGGDIEEWPEGLRVREWPTYLHSTEGA